MCCGFISTCTEKKSVVFKLYLKPLLNQSQNKSSICPNQEKVTFDLVSLAIVLASCLWTSSLSQRYCYGGLIVTCHKSSFDQLIFTYCSVSLNCPSSFSLLCCYFFLLFPVLSLSLSVSCHPSPSLFHSFIIFVSHLSFSIHFYSFYVCLYVSI